MPPSHMPPTPPLPPAHPSPPPLGAGPAPEAEGGEPGEPAEQRARLLEAGRAQPVEAAAEGAPAGRAGRESARAHVPGRPEHTPDFWSAPSRPLGCVTRSSNATNRLHVLKLGSRRSSSRAPPPGPLSPSRRAGQGDGRRACACARLRQADRRLCPPLTPALSPLLSLSLSYTHTLTHSLCPPPSSLSHCLTLSESLSLSPSENGAGGGGQSGSDRVFGRNGGAKGEAERMGGRRERQYRVVSK